MELIPVQDYVVLKPIKRAQETETGIVVPDSADQSPSDQAIVIAKGDGVTIAVENGAHVLFKPYGFEEVVVGKEQFLIGKCENITAIIEDSN